VHLHPEQVGKLVELNGLDRGDLHRAPSPARPLSSGPA